MDTVENIFAQARQMGAQPVSFEIFPPKGELSMESVFRGRQRQQAGHR